jgi:DNA topoisomerase-1
VDGAAVIPVFEALFRNKGTFPTIHFEQDLPFITYYAPLSRRLCVHMTSRARANVERVNAILDNLSKAPINILPGVALRQIDATKTRTVDIHKLKKGARVWNTLEHNGPYFKHLVDPYVPHNAPLLYDGKAYPLSPTEEEFASMYAAQIISDETGTKKWSLRDKFNDNFWTDFRKYLSPEHRKIFKSFVKFDFSPIVYALKQRKEAQKASNLDADQKREKQIKTLVTRADHGFAYIDGVPVEIGAYAVQPAGIYKGAGDVMTDKGKIKRHIFPEDVVINIGPNAPTPLPPPPHTWGGIINNPNTRWIYKYNNPVTGKTTHVYPKERGGEFVKFEKARKLNNMIDTVRQKYTALLRSLNPVERKIGTIVYLIDNYGIRPGSEDNMGDESEQVIGATTIRVKEVQLLPNNQIKLTFKGKDSVLYDQTLSVSKEVYANFRDFMRGKRGDDPVFDQIRVEDVNDYLKSIDPEFTAKVFRTRLASSIMYRGLAEGNTLMHFTSINTRVAERLNHKKTITPKGEDSVAKKVARLDALREEMKGAQDKRLERFQKEIDKLELQLAKTPTQVSLTTSLKNYIDPRVVITWAATNEVPLNKIYTPILKKQFAWAIGEDEDEIDGSWDYELAPLDPVVNISDTPVAKPAVARPAVARPAVAKPAVAKPAVAKPAVAKPAVAKPAVAKPAVAKPAVAKPAVAKPTINFLSKIYKNIPFGPPSQQKREDLYRFVKNNPDVWNALVESGNRPLYVNKNRDTDLERVRYCIISIE